MRSLAIAAALIVLATAAPAHAQPSPPPVVAPPPTVAPPIVLPFPPLMTPPAGGLPPPIPESPRFRTDTPLYGPGSPTMYAPFAFGYSGADDPAEKKRSSPSRPQVAALSTGLLRLAVTPGTAEVFVDSYYVGTVDDLSTQSLLELGAGPHRIEFRAPQYQSHAVDIRILPLDTFTYRAALEPMTKAPAVPAAARRPTPMYVIPNCYLGNVPPRPSRLVSGCDINKVQVLGIGAR